jgi:glucose/arabinose dehydrogenase
MKSPSVPSTSALILSLFMLPASMAIASGTAETRAAHGKDQQPAFADQTRAPLPEAPTRLKNEVYAKDLPHLWSFEFLPDGRIIAAAKAGEIVLLTAEQKQIGVEGVPAVDSSGQGGLLDLALAPDFDKSRKIFFSFAEPRDGGNGTSVASATLVEDGNSARLEDLAVIFRQTPSYDGDKHFGSRLVFGTDGNLFITTGERSDSKPRVQSQDLSSGLGKIFRVTQEGKALDDNAFANQAGALPEIWSYGHRNLQAATLDGEGKLWTVEHGPKGGDELNLPEAGKNYGWPIITYGVEYSGRAVGDGLTAKDGMEQPVYYWDPVIGPSGMTFYDGEAIAALKGKFVIGGLVTQGLVILGIKDDKVVSEERIPLKARIRDVKQGPDGAIYALTEDGRGSGSHILKLTSE